MATFARSDSIFCCSCPARAATCASICCSAAFTWSSYWPAWTSTAPASPANRAVPLPATPVDGKLHLAHEKVPELIARNRVVLVARVADADLRAAHLDLPPDLGNLVAVALEVVLVRVELGLKPLEAGGVARDTLLGPVVTACAAAR